VSAPRIPRILNPPGPPEVSVRIGYSLSPRYKRLFIHVTRTSFPFFSCSSRKPADGVCSSLLELPSAPWSV